jgi:hypothetical protein
MSQTRFFGRKQIFLINLILFIYTLSILWEPLEAKEEDPLKDLFLVPEAKFADTFDMLGNVAYLGLAQFIVFCESHNDMKQYIIESKLINELSFAGDNVIFEKIHDAFNCSDLCIDKDNYLVSVGGNNCDPAITYNNSFHCSGWESEEKAKAIKRDMDDLSELKDFMSAYENLKNNINNNSAYHLLIDLGLNLKSPQFNGILHNATNIFNYHTSPEKLIEFITNVKPAIRKEYVAKRNLLKNPVHLVTNRNKEGLGEKIKQSKDNNQRNFFILGYSHCLINLSGIKKFYNLRKDNLRPELQENLQDTSHAIVIFKKH